MNYEKVPGTPTNKTPRNAASPRWSPVSRLRGGEGKGRILLLFFSRGVFRSVICSPKQALKTSPFTSSQSSAAAGGGRGGGARHTNETDKTSESDAVLAKTNKTTQPRSFRSRGISKLRGDISRLLRLSRAEPCSDSAASVSPSASLAVAIVPRLTLAERPRVYKLRAEAPPRLPRRKSPRVRYPSHCGGQSRRGSSPLVPKGGGGAETRHRNKGKPGRYLVPQNGDRKRGPRAFGRNAAFPPNPAHFVSDLAAFLSLPSLSKT